MPFATLTPTFEMSMNENQYEMKQNDKIHECVILYEIYIVRILKKIHVFQNVCSTQYLCPDYFQIV